MRFRILKNDGKTGFIVTYFTNIKTLILMLIVCVVIALVNNYFNKTGLLANIGFSFSYGFPISMLETFFYLRFTHWPERRKNLASILIGCVVGTVFVYGYLVYSGTVSFGDFGPTVSINFGFGLTLAVVAFYFFWSRYRNQELQLELRDQQLKMSELETLRVQAENRLLQSQMEPHFLFNTLANIQSLVDIDAGNAKLMIGELSNMLRAALRYSAEDTCGFSQELELVRAYLKIQKMRIGERLIVEEDISERAESARVVPMLLQPLVENAIRHGVEKNPKPTTLSIVVSVDDDVLTIEVKDNAPALPASPGHGLSLSNIKKRLLNQFGDRAALMTANDPNGWRSTVQMPFRRNQE